MRGAIAFPIAVDPVAETRGTRVSSASCTARSAPPSTSAKSPSGTSPCRSAARARSDVVAIAAGCVASAIVAYAVLVALRPIGSFPAVEIFVVDAVLATLLVGASRLTLRLLPELQGHRLHRQRVLVVGAGAAGRGLARELRESHEARVVGFLDDNPRVRRRRILGISVVGSLDDLEPTAIGAGDDPRLTSEPESVSTDDVLGASVEMIAELLEEVRDRQSRIPAAARALAQQAPATVDGPAARVKALARRLRRKD